MSVALPPLACDASADSAQIGRPLPNDRQPQPTGRAPASRLSERQRLRPPRERRLGGSACRARGLRADGVSGPREHGRRAHASTVSSRSRWLRDAVALIGRDAVSPWAGRVLVGRRRAFALCIECAAGEVAEEASGPSVRSAKPSQLGDLRLARVRLLVGAAPTNELGSR